MLVPLLTLFISGIAALLGRVLIYAAQFEAWLKYWAYGAYIFAVLFVLAFIVEFFKSIARARRRRRAKQGTMPKTKQTRHKPPRR